MVSNNDKSRKILGIALNRDAHRTLKEISQETDRSLSWLIRHAIDRYIEHYRAKDRDTVERTNAGI